MSNLVPIPWQPNYFITPDTLALLVAASKRVGYNIEVVDAWRSWDTQDGYWMAYMRYLNGGPYAPVASNPNTGQRNHMRGGAVDLKDPSQVNRAAMLAVGFTPDPVEDWHFNNPNWQSMPIIPVNIISTGGNVVTIPTNPKRSTARMEPISYIRNPANGEITMLDYTNMTRRTLSGSEWAALSIQGNAFANATSATEYGKALAGFKPKI